MTEWAQVRADLKEHFYDVYLFHLFIKTIYPG